MNSSVKDVKANPQKKSGRPLNTLNQIVCGLPFIAFTDPKIKLFNINRMNWGWTADALFKGGKGMIRITVPLGGRGVLLRQAIIEPHYDQITFICRETHPDAMRLNEKRFFPVQVRKNEPHPQE